MRKIILLVILCLLIAPGAVMVTAQTPAPQIATSYPAAPITAVTAYPAAPTTVLPQYMTETKAQTDGIVIGASILVLLILLGTIIGINSKRKRPYRPPEQAAEATEAEKQE